MSKHISRTGWAAIAALALSLGSRPAHAETYTMRDDDLTKVDPEPGRETAKPFKPSWCGTVEPGNGNGGALRRTFEAWMKYGSDDGLRKVASYLCDSPDDANVQKQAGYVIQNWINWTGLGEKEAKASFIARIDKDKWEKQRTETCAKYAATAEDSEEIAEVNAAYRAIYGCPAEPPSWVRRLYPKNLAWFVDRDADPPEVLRAYMVIHGLIDANNLKPADTTMYGYHLRGYILYGADARRLDRARLDKELADGGMNEYAQWIARETHGVAIAQAKLWEKHVAEVAAKDPDLKKMLLDVPEQAWKEWVEIRKKEAAAFEDGAAFEQQANSPSRSAVKGCGAKLRPHVGKVLAAKKPTDVKSAAIALMSDPVGGPTAERWVLCEAMERNASLAQMMYHLYSSSRGHRGPRAAVYIAAMDTLSSILADREKFVIRPDQFKSAGYSTVGYRVSKLLSDSGLDSEQQGVVASIKKVDGGNLITFAKEAHWEDDWDCKDTNKIYRIDSNGRVEYVQDCKKIGRHKVDTTAKPLVLADDMMAGVKKGTLLVARPDRKKPSGDTFFALPVAVFDGKEKKKLLSVWGFDL